MSNLLRCYRDSNSVTYQSTLLRSRSQRLAYILIAFFYDLFVSPLLQTAFMGICIHLRIDSVSDRPEL